VNTPNPLTSRLLPFPPISSFISGFIFALPLVWEQGEYLLLWDQVPPVNRPGYYCTDGDTAEPLLRILQLLFVLIRCSRISSLVRSSL
jgi:hypothetical protein